MASIESIGYALFMQPSSDDPEIAYSAAKLRSLFTALIDTEGIVGQSSFKVRPRAAGANMTVEVDPGTGAVDGDDVSNQNRYVADSNSIVSLDIPAVQSGSEDYHKIVLRIRDKLHNSTWSTYDAALEVITGDTEYPPTPDSAIELARITVTDTTTEITEADIEDTRELARKHGASRHVIGGDDPVPHGTELIERIDLSSNQLTVEFTSIPQHYHTLILDWMGRHDWDTQDIVRIRMRFNGNDADEYYSQLNTFINDGTKAGFDTRPAASFSACLLGSPVASNGSSGTISILDYSTTSGRRSFHASGFASTSGSAGGAANWISGGTVNNLSPVSSIQLYVNEGHQFVSGSQFSLYGLR